MAGKPPSEPQYPRSPDELGGGLRGPIRGVTRIGPRAFGLAFIVVCGLLVAILVGVNRSSPSNSRSDAFASPAPPKASDEERFAANEPLVPTSAPVTPAPPIDLSTTPPVAQQAVAPQAAPVRAAQANSLGNAGNAAASAEAAREQQEEAEREKAATERLLAARRSAILAGSNQGGSGGDIAGTSQGGPTRLAFAGNGGGSDTIGRFVSANGNGGGGRFASVGGGPSSNLGQSDSQSAAQSSKTGFLNGPTDQYLAQNSDVVAPPQSGNSKDFLQSRRFAPASPYEITASSVIPASLITGIDSELPGLVSAQVRQDVYDTKTGKYLLVPRGSRLVGLYQNNIAYGQSRVLVAWQRLIFPDTSSIDLDNMNGNDVEGFAGATGKVDNHYASIFGAALLTSVLAAGVELAQSQQGNSLLLTPSVGQTLGQSVGTQIAQTGTQLVQKNLNVPPTIYIPKGYPFIVFVDRDIVLPGPYTPK